MPIQSVAYYTWKQLFNLNGRRQVNVSLIYTLEFVKGLVIIIIVTIMSIYLDDCFAFASDLFVK